MTFITFHSLVNILRENYLVTWHWFLRADRYHPSKLAANQTKGKHRAGEKSLEPTSLPHAMTQFLVVKHWKPTRCWSNSQHTTCGRPKLAPALHPGETHSAAFICAVVSGPTHADEWVMDFQPLLHQGWLSHLLQDKILRCSVSATALCFMLKFPHTEVQQSLGKQLARVSLAHSNYGSRSKPWMSETR